MNTLNDIKKSNPPVWSEAKWKSLEDSVISEIQNKKKVRLLPFSYSAAALAAAAAFIFAVIIFREPVKESVASAKSVTELKAGLRISSINADKYTSAIDAGTRFILSERGEIEFIEFSNKAVIIKLTSGSIDLEVSKRKEGQIFQVVTAGAVAEVVGTRFRVELLDDGDKISTRLSVSEGIVKFYPPGQIENELFVRAGESAIIRGGRIIPPLAKTVQNVTEKRSLAANSSIVLNSSRQLALMKMVIEQSSDIAAADTSALKSNSILVSTEYVVAKSRLESGDFTGALAIINRLLVTDSLSDVEKLNLLQDRAAIFRQTGDLSAYVVALEELSRLCCDSLSADNQLWEAILIRSRDLSDFTGSAASIKEYLARFPKGQWREEALLKYAEVRYALRQIDSAVASYKNFIGLYPKSASIDRALYHLAHIESHEIGDCNSAAGRFSRIATGIPGSSLAEDAAFWYADCIERTGDRKTARSAYDNYLKSYPDGRWAESAKKRMKR
ncbi:MAG: tetratricopeptide repeat protein [Fibrobacteres bacterium]|nr:tetratricopeptide repeat protein [Fibrobacterota bacterium]